VWVLQVDGDLVCPTRQGLARDVEHDPEVALSVWREYEQRFPEGLLAPEVGIAVLRLLLADKQYAEALAEVQAVRARLAQDPRAPELALIAAKLLCTQFGRLSDGLAALDQATAATAAEVREEALFTRGACLELLGDPVEARSAWAAYVRQFPHGAHADEAGARLLP